MAEAKKTDSPKAEPQKTEPAGRGAAAASGDAGVQQLLAQRQAATMNDDNAELDRIDKELVDLGFTEYKH